MFTFIETVLFTKLVREYLSDEEYSRLQQALSVLRQIGEEIDDD